MLACVSQMERLCACWPLFLFVYPWLARLVPPWIRKYELHSQSGWCYLFQLLVWQCLLICLKLSVVCDRNSLGETYLVIFCCMVPENFAQQLGHFLCKACLLESLCYLWVRVLSVLNGVWSSFMFIEYHYEVGFSWLIPMTIHSRAHS